MDPFNRKFQAALFLDKRLLERRIPSGLTNKDLRRFGRRFGRRFESKSVLVDEITSTYGNWRNRGSP